MKNDDTFDRPGFGEQPQPRVKNEELVVDNLCKACEGTGRVPFGGWENGEVSDNVCLDCDGSGRKK